MCIWAWINPIDVIAKWDCTCPHAKLVNMFNGNI